MEVRHERRVVTMDVEILYNFISNLIMPFRVPESDGRVLEIHTIYHQLRCVHAMNDVEVEQMVVERRVVEQEIVQRIEW